MRHSYTFGGAAAIRLGAKEYINSIVVATPARTSMREYKEIRIPTLFICAEGAYGIFVLHLWDFDQAI